MDPLHPIIPVSPDISMVAAPPAVRRVARDGDQPPRRQAGKEQRRDQPPRDQGQDDGRDGHVDITA